MNTIAKMLFSTAIITLATASHAELVLDTKYLGSDKELKQLESTRAVSGFFTIHEEKIKTDLLTRGEIAPTSLITWGGMVMPTLSLTARIIICAHSITKRLSKIKGVEQMSAQK